MDGDVNLADVIKENASSIMSALDKEKLYSLLP